MTNDNKPPARTIFKIIRMGNYSLGWSGLTLMQRTMIQASYIMLTHVISLVSTLRLCNNNDITLSSMI